MNCSLAIPQPEGSGSLPLAGTTSLQPGEGTGQGCCGTVPAATMSRYLQPPHPPRQSWAGSISSAGVEKHLTAGTAGTDIFKSPIAQAKYFPSFQL